MMTLMLKRFYNFFNWGFYYGAGLLSENKNRCLD